MQQANFVCGALVLVSEALKNKPALWGAITQPEDSTGDATATPAIDSANGASTAGAAVARGSDDEDSDRDVDEDARELIELTRLAAEASAAADNSAAPGKTLPSRSAAAAGTAAVTKVAMSVKLSSASSNGNSNGGAAAKAAKAASAWPREEYYSMGKRAPQHAHAETACFWELLVLADSVHPSVSTMARTLLAGTSIVYSGNPLADLTLAAFLDKFVTKCAPKNTPNPPLIRGALIRVVLIPGALIPGALIPGALIPGV